MAFNDCGLSRSSHKSFGPSHADDAIDGDISEGSAVSAVLLLVYVAVNLILFATGMTIGKKPSSLRVIVDNFSIRFIHSEHGSQNESWSVRWLGGASYE